MKRALVLGASGLIGSNLVQRLKRDGYRVRAVGRRPLSFAQHQADEYITTDLRRITPNDWLFDGIDECYQLAAEAGGLGYVMDEANDAVMLHNSARINLNILEGCKFNRIQKVFFASSGCVYGEGTGGPCKESEVPPLYPHNEYAVEKFFAERLYAAYARKYDIDVKIARLHSTYGTPCIWEGTRARAPAALCRKVAEASEYQTLTRWGDGKQTRSFMHADDAVEGIIRFMASDFQGPLNIGSAEQVTIDQMIGMICSIAGKKLGVARAEGPEGVRGRSSDNTLIREKLGWEPQISLREGLARLYPWIEARVLDKNPVVV